MGNRGTHPSRGVASDHETSSRRRPLWKGHEWKESPAQRMVSAQRQA